MSEQRAPYTIATATRPFSVSRDESVTLVTTKRKASFLHKIETIGNQSKRGDTTPWVLVNSETLEVGSIIAFEV